MARKTSRRYGEGSVYAYSNKGKTAYRWQASVLVNPELGKDGFKRKSQGGFATRKAAEQDMQEALRNTRIGQAALPSTESFESWAKTWLAGKPDLATTSHQGYEKIIRVHLVPNIGSLALGDLTSARVNILYAQLRQSGNKGRYTAGQNLSANTMNKIHTVLGAIMDAAVDNFKVPTNVVRAKSVIVPSAKAIRNERKELKPWKKAEVSLFLKWSQDVDKDDLFPLWHIFCHTGMRRGEGVALIWDDINWETKRIAIKRATDSGKRKSLKPPKSGNARNISISDETIAVLKAHRAERAKLGLQFVKPDAFIFGTLDGSVRNPGDVGGRWSTALARAYKVYPELPRITIKGLRHTHATILLESKAQTKVVQERLGHSNYSTTMNIYSHVTETMQDEAVAQFTRAINGH
jgi:integrase